MEADTTTGPPAAPAQGDQVGDLLDFDLLGDGTATGTPPSASSPVPSESLLEPTPSTPNKDVDLLGGFMTPAGDAAENVDTAAPSSSLDDLLNLDTTFAAVQGDPQPSSSSDSVDLFQPAPVDATTSASLLAPSSTSQENGTNEEAHADMAQQPTVASIPPPEPDTAATSASSNGVLMSVVPTTPSDSNNIASSNNLLGVPSSTEQATEAAAPANNPPPISSTDTSFMSAQEEEEPNKSLVVEDDAVAQALIDTATDIDGTNLDSSLLEAPSSTTSSVQPTATLATVPPPPSAQDTAATTSSVPPAEDASQKPKVEVSDATRPESSTPTTTPSSAGTSSQQPSPMSSAETSQSTFTAAPAPAQTTTSTSPKKQKSQSVLMLCSFQSMDRNVTANQDVALAVLKRYSLPHETLDGADPDLVEVRNNLFTLSGLPRGQYPQFFLVVVPESNGDTAETDLVFWGDWERFHVANENGTIVQDLGFDHLSSTTTTGGKTATPPASKSPEATTSPTTAEAEKSPVANGEASTAVAPTQNGSLTRESSKDESAAIANTFLSTPETDKSAAATDSSDVAVQPTAASSPASLVDVKEKEALQSRIAALEAELAESRKMVETLRKEQEQTSNDASILMELQTSLEQQMSLKAEAENKARLLQDRFQKLETENKEQDSELEKFKELESNLQQQMSAKAEAENRARLAEQKGEELEAAKTQRAADLDKLQRELVQLREDSAAREQEVEKIREQRDEQERKEMSLTNRLNAAKKKEGEKANLAEQLEDDLKSAEKELEETKNSLSALETKKNALEKELVQVKKTAEEQLQHVNKSLADEKRLNEERKKKMKVFVEKKTEELQQAKADNESLQNEVAQTNRSLVDLNGRWKQLHAQWVQSQTRNRELQRDLNKIKKDSENLHKQGDSLEMKLSRSANETEEHKSKRLAAKNELMTVLRTLEAERQLSSRLRDSLKFTFTPKALSQQQLLKEGLDEFEAELLRLSQRLGRPLPPTVESMGDMSERTATSVGEDEDVVEESVLSHSKSEAETDRLIAKLERETQRLSQCIVALSGGIERMHVMLDASGDRTCFTALSEILARGAVASSAPREETTSMTGAPRRLASVRSHQYGQVPPSDH